MLLVGLTLYWFCLQRPDKEQKDLVSRWTELGTDGPGITLTVCIVMKTDIEIC